MKLKAAPNRTAVTGFSTRVQTTVAIAFDASFQPLARSKRIAPSTIIQPTNPRWSIASRKLIRARRSAVPDDDRFDDVGDVGAGVGRLLEVAVDVLPLDDLDR